jgi:hypothetical protein
MEKLTAKSSTIFIATGEETRVYRSVRDIPPALRRRLEESTNGTNSATILIADKRGREELVRVLQGLPSDVQSRLAHTLRANQPAQPQGSRKSSRRKQSLRRWLEILAPVVVGLSVWFLASSH